VPARLPSLLADPADGAARLWLTGGRLFDGTGAEVRESSGVLVQDGRIAAVGLAADGVPDGATVVELAGRTLLPGLIDAHSHITVERPTPAPGAEALRSGTDAHFLAADLREMLRRGVTTVRDVGSYGDLAIEARQAIRYGAFRGPRILTCGRIISATAPGGIFFEGMYREADGPDDVRRAVREQLRRGADFIKVMTTGARSVEIEDPDPAQLTRAEIATVVEEAHRQGYRVAAHAEGIDGTEIAIQEGIDTIEHGMYLNQRPELLERMAASGQVLVPTLSGYYWMGGLGDVIDPTDAAVDPEMLPSIVELAHYNLEQGTRSLRAAREAGVRIALGSDRPGVSGEDTALELVRMIHHGLAPVQALLSATAVAARAIGLEDHIGTIAPGRLADLAVLDGDVLREPELLLDAGRVWLVLQLGEVVAGAALEAPIPTPA